ncbi:MAG: ABC transporter permease, partial [Armatimonadota bacterium]
PTADILGNDLAKIGTVATRAWYTSAQVDKELMVDVSNAADPAKKYVISCILGLSPQEAQVMNVKNFLIAGRWFKPGDKDVCMLPASIAEALGITSAQLGSAEVRIFGTSFRVVGLVSEDGMRKTRDLDGEPMMPVNYALLRPEVLKELQRQAEQKSQMGQTNAESLLQEYKHFGPEKLLILPYDTTLEFGGTLRSLAIKYNDPEQVIPSVRGMMNRFALSLYAGYKEQTILFSSVGVTSFSGLEQLVIPILIAALIVLNTMLGSVHERVREIGIYSSLGLAPTHVSMLFLAEACVFANLGAIMGYLLGQVITKILYATGSMHGIELNYSSMSAVSVTVVVIIVVLLSTLYPSKKAGEIASPGIERKWSLPAAVGDLMIVVLPFTVTGRDAWGVTAFLKEFFDEYVGYAGGEFLAEDVNLHATDSPQGKGMQVSLRMWLAPYDLGVSQAFRLDCEPTEDGDIFSIVLRLDRLAGDITSWRKTNTLFLAGIRKQFLIWRTVPQSEKVAYADRAERILRGEEPTEDLP